MGKINEDQFQGLLDAIIDGAGFAWVGMEGWQMLLETT